MDYSFYLQKYIPDKKKLTDYGFVQDGQAFVYKKRLKQPDLYAVIKIDETQIEVRVIDSAFDDDFIPFGVKDYQCPEKYEVERLLEDITTKCFYSIDVVENITKYVLEKYGVVREAPWDYLPGYYTFKAPNSKKWFAIIMHLKANKIGLEGENLIDVINVKIDTDKIAGLVDNKHYFNSYHMNKQNWITVLLDRYSDTEMLTRLIDDSFLLVETPKKAQKEWLVPANPKYYDVDSAIHNSPDNFIWKQSNDIQVKDIVYLYIASPVSAIKYKCEVLKTHIPYEYADGNVSMKYVMELRLLQEYGTPIPFDFLKKFGVNAIRGPRSLPEKLKEEIAKYK